MYLKISVIKRDVTRVSYIQHIGKWVEYSQYDKKDRKINIETIKSGCLICNHIVMKYISYKGF